MHETGAIEIRATIHDTGAIEIRATIHDTGAIEIRATETACTIASFAVMSLGSPLTSIAPSENNHHLSGPENGHPEVSNRVLQCKLTPPKGPVQFAVS
jgi:hypothetical protein